MRNVKCLRRVMKWRVSLKRTHAAEDGSAPGHRSRNSAFQTHAASSHEEVDATRKYSCIRGDKSAGLAGVSPCRGRSIGHELLDNARVFSELSHDVVRLIDAVENTASKLVSPSVADQQQYQHFSTLASQVLKNAQRGSASCKHIDAVIADSVDRIRQSILVMEHAGFQMLHIIDSVIQGAEMTADMEHARQAASQPVVAFKSDADDDDGDLLQQEAALAVQDLKCWALVLKRNLQLLRLSEQDEQAGATWQVGDGTRG
jgi:hypothetical protein